jgi:hypothetical protein
MTKVILSVGAVLAAAVVLAGCGGGGGATAGGTVSTPAGTTGGVAGVSTTKTSTTVTAQSGGGSFNATATGLSSRIRNTVKQFMNGNASSAISSGTTLLATCGSTVDEKLAPKAMNSNEKQAVADLRIACRDLSTAATAAGSGNTTKAQAYAKQALQQAKSAGSAIAG